MISSRTNLHAALKSANCFSQSGGRVRSRVSFVLRVSCTAFAGFSITLSLAFGQGTRVDSFLCISLFLCVQAHKDINVHTAARNVVNILNLCLSATYLSVL